MSISANHAAVKANFLDWECRNGFQFCGNKIRFCNAILFIQDVQQVQLDSFAFFGFLERHRTNQNIQFFPPNQANRWTFHLFGCQMRQQVGYTKYRIAFSFADVDGYLAAVCLDDHTMQGKRNGCPLILLNAAVVMGLEQSKFAIFIQWILLHVQTRRVNVCSTKPNALGNRCRTNDGGNHCLSTVVLVNLIAGFQSHTRRKRNKSMFFQQGFCVGTSLPFGLRLVQECHIVLAKCFTSGLVVFAHPQCTMFFGSK